MAKWEETVMSDEQVIEIIHRCTGAIKDARTEVNKAQAELTWKAREPEIEEARKAGRQEVVEFLVKDGEQGLLVNLNKLSEKFGKPSSNPGA